VARKSGIGTETNKAILEIVSGRSPVGGLYLGEIIGNELTRVWHPEELHDVIIIESAIHSKKQNTGHDIAIRISVES